jgi:hypothetical protein
MAKEKDRQRVVTPMGRISFPKVFKAEAFKDQKPKFSCTILFKKNTDLSELKKAVHAAKVAKWGKDKEEWPKRLRSPFNDGNEKADLDGYKGMIYVTASNQHRPQVVDKNMEAIDEASGDFYAGCYGRLALRAFAYDTAGNKGVSFSLEHVQKLKDGEPFSGKPKVEDVFDEVDDGESDDDEDDGVADDEDEDDDGGF